MLKHLQAFANSENPLFALYGVGTASKPLSPDPCAVENPDISLARRLRCRDFLQAVGIDFKGPSWWRLLGKRNRGCQRSRRASGTLSTRVLSTGFVQHHGVSWNLEFRGPRCDLVRFRIDHAPSGSPSCSGGSPQPGGAIVSGFVLGPPSSAGCRRGREERDAGAGPVVAPPSLARL